MLDSCTAPARATTTEACASCPLGSGHPTLGVNVGDAHVRHQPPALAAVAGDLFVPSQYFRLLLSRNGTQLRLPGKPIAFVGSADGGRFEAAFDDGTLREI